MDTARVATTEIRSGGAHIAEVEPEIRFYQARRMSRTEAGIATLGLGQVYVGISAGSTEGSLDARLYWKPLVVFIWLGAVVMAFGGLLSLSDRRLRFGVARRTSKLAAAAAPQPAE